MKIVLLQVKRNFTPIPPLGILYLGTVLKNNGYDVKVYDIIKTEKEKIIDEIKNFNPDLVGFSVMTSSYSITKEINRALKKELPNCLFCWGGSHPTALPAETLKDNNLNFVVYGEAEETILDVCKRLEKKKDLKDVKGVVFRKNKKIIDNGPRRFLEDLDKIPIPDRGLLQNFSWYLSPPGILRGKFNEGITTIFTSRGCPYKCIFCASKDIHGPKIRKRSVENVIKEIKELIQNFGVKGVYICDDTFATDISWLEGFCKKIKEVFPNLIWGCQTRANIAQNIEILKMIKDAGCVQVDIGAESGSEKVLQNLRKGITPEMTEKAFNNLKKVGIRTFATFTLGNPGETIEDIKKTEELAKKAPGHVSFLILTPYPGCEFYEMSKKNNWFKDDNLIFDDRWTNKQSEDPVVEVNIKTEELLKIRARLMNKFFFQNNFWFGLAFFKNPNYSFKMIKTILKHPNHIYSALKNSIKQKKTTLFLEELYQKFNEELRTKWQ